MKNLRSALVALDNMKKSLLNTVRYFAIPLFAVCFFGLSPAHAQDGYNRHVEIINKSHYTVRSFYASNVDSSVWEEDILGVGVLAPGYEVDVNINDGTGHCHYDLKAVFSNGQQVIRRNVNVCSITSWTLYD
jgi:hypothetical protein